MTKALLQAAAGGRRLLVLSPFAPRLDASMGGPRVIAQMLTALACRERVALLYLRAADEPPLDEPVKAACEFAVETMRAPDDLPGLQQCIRSGLSALRGTPGWVRGWTSPAFACTLNSLLAGWQPDIVQAEFHLMGQYLPRVPAGGPPTVLVEHEPGAAAAAERRRSRLMPGRVLPALEVRAWQLYERWLVRQADAVVAFTERDRCELRRLGCGRVEVIAPGTCIPAQPANAAGEPPPNILFFGNYLHTPNVDAALRLARDIYPLLRAAIPDLRLVLPGDRPPAALHELAGGQIEAPGCVPDLKPYLDRAAVVVVPLRVGGGMRVKVLEAIAAGKAVVASGLALEGLDLVHGEQAICAETDAEFVAATLHLLRNPEERTALAARARAWATTHLSWERAATQYGALYDDLIAQGPERVGGVRDGVRDGVRSSVRAPVHARVQRK